MSADEPSRDAAPPPQGPRQGPPVLRRSVGDRMLFGVAAGLGRYLGVDATIVRSAFVLLALFGGSGVVLYLVGLVAMPEERAGEPVQHAASPRLPGNALAIVGAVLIVIGAWALLRQILPGVGTVAGPLVLLAAGALLILAGRR